MIYGGEISTPASTVAASPQVTEYAIVEGIIYHLKVMFPPGPSGLLHVQVCDATYQVFPTTMGEPFVGDNLLLTFDVLYAKVSAPLVLQVKTWNLDDTYAHKCGVYLSMESSEEFKARYLPMIASNVISGALVQEEVAKAAGRRTRLESFLAAIDEVKEA